MRRFFLSAYFGLQSTRPCGRDPRSGLPLQAAPYFNPRAPRGGRRAVDRISKRTAKFQSTRPRGGTTHLPCLFCSIVTISIHTPRMGARRAVARLRLHEPPISIHAPRMGARPKARPALRHRFAISIHTPRMGARLTHVVHGHGVPEISIHAPRVGARRRRRSCRTSRYLFQSTRPRGARRRSNANFAFSVSFQSTRPRGARRKRGVLLQRVQVFQSTRPRGARPALGKHSSMSL